MANLYRPAYTKIDKQTGEKTSGRLRKWYAKYRDPDGVLRKVPLCEDKSAAQAMLTDLMRKVQRQQAGLLDPAADQLARPISEHVKEYQRHLLAKARSDSHITETVRLLNNIAESCRCRILADLQKAGDKLTEHLATRLEEGSSHRTVNADLIAVRSFCRWLLAKKRLHTDPTAGLERLNVEEDRRLERRSLTDQEAQKLIETTYKSPKVIRGLSGLDRAMLYWLAQRTGLRRKELRSLYPASFDLEADPASVRLTAKHSKRRKNDLLPLSPDVAVAFLVYLKERDPKQPVWPGGWWRRSAEMLRDDLAAAGIAAVDADGQVLDFHGQRTTFISGLARAGVSPATTQKLARHSDINLTMGTYTRLGVADLSTAVDRLPRLTLLALPAPQAEPPSPDSESSDSQLQQLTMAWQSIPSQVKASIMALVASALADDHAVQIGEKSAGEVPPLTPESGSSNDFKAKSSAPPTRH